MNKTHKHDVQLPSLFGNTLTCCPQSAKSGGVRAHEAANKELCASMSSACLRGDSQCASMDVVRERTNATNHASAQLALYEAQQGTLHLICLAANHG
jgi:hypothetical protein